MTIGSRIQRARVQAGLTQEQAAERLKVSRQTISNWENDKTLPDVALAQEISQVYGVGLDELISGIVPVENHDSVPTKIESNEGIGRAWLWCYGIVWLCCVLFFWMFGSGGGFAMFYAIFVYGLFYHSVSALVAFLLGLFDCWPVKRYLLVFLFGVGQMLLPWLTYSLANTIASGNINPLPWTDFVTGICISAVCITLGSLVNWLADFLSSRLENLSSRLEKRFKKAE